MASSHKKQELHLDECHIIIVDAMAKQFHTHFLQKYDYITLK